MYVVTTGKRLFIGGRQITPSNIEVYCTQKQIDALVKNKTIKKKKGESDERESKSTKAKGEEILPEREVS